MPSLGDQEFTYEHAGQDTGLVLSYNGSWDSTEICVENVKIERVEDERALIFWLLDEGFPLRWIGQVCLDLPGGDPGAVKWAFIEQPFRQQMQSEANLHASALVGEMMEEKR